MAVSNVPFLPIQQLPPTHREPFSTLLRVGDRLSDQMVVMRVTNQRRIKSKIPTTCKDNFNVLLEHWRDEDDVDPLVRNMVSRSLRSYELQSLCIVGNRVSCTATCAYVHIGMILRLVLYLIPVLL
jgi:hypothetical protein